MTQRTKPKSKSRHPAPKSAKRATGGLTARPGATRKETTGQWKQSNEVHSRPLPDGSWPWKQPDAGIPEITHEPSGFEQLWPLVPWAIFASFVICGILLAR